MDTQQTLQITPIIQRGFVPFSYEDIRIKQSCWDNGVPYFTMRAIGEWAEYKNPEKAIFKIIHRNPHIRQFSKIIKLKLIDDYPKEGHSVPNLGTECPARLAGESSLRTREIEHEVFDPIGLQLIINKSNQPKAIAFQVAAAHLVVAYMTGNLKPFKWSGDVALALSQIISMTSGSKRKLKVFELAKETGKHWNTIYRMAKKMNGQNLKTKGNKPRKIRANKDSFVNYPEFQQVINYSKEHPAAGGKEIQAALEIPYSTSSINRWIRYIRGLPTPAPYVGQASSPDIIMTDGDVRPTNRGD